MNKIPFKEYHLLKFFESYESSTCPLDLALHLYFKNNRSLGSKDKAFIAEYVYGIIRWRSLLDYYSSRPTSYAKRLQIFKTFDPLRQKCAKNIPPHILVSFPQQLFELIKKSRGLKKALDICVALNTPAPTTIRVNPLKTTRKKMLNILRKKYNAFPCKRAEQGIILEKRINFFELPEFKKGFFEAQDEASQLVADLLKAGNGAAILDYCAGSGGKTLAFAPKLKSSGQIYLHDIRPRALLEAKKRLKRAGIQNVQIIKPDSPNLKKLKKRMDWVFVDVPCTGSGTYRRSPDMKWRFSIKNLRELIGKQKIIFERALSFLKPGGKIIYATCSILKEENQEQIAHFLKTYNLELIGTPFQSTPEIGGMDAFFAATFQLNRNPRF